MKKNQLIIIWMMVSILLMGAILYIAGKRTDAVMDWADRYDACVLQQYGTSAAAWNAEHGKYPPCKVNTDAYENK